jgi:hypothetical protein
VPSDFAEHLFHQLGCAVGDLRLIGEVAGRIDEHAQLHDPLDAIEASKRLLHLGDQHQPAKARGLRAIFEVAILAEPAGHHLAIVERQLA